MPLQNLKSLFVFVCHFTMAEHEVRPVHHDHTSTKRISLEVVQLRHGSGCEISSWHLAPIYYAFNRVKHVCRADERTLFVHRLHTTSDHNPDKPTIAAASEMVLDCRPAKQLRQTTQATPATHHHRSKHLEIVKV